MKQRAKGKVTKRWWALLCALTLTVMAHGQTALSGTVIDQQGSTWQNAAWTLSFTPTAACPGIPNGSSGVFSGQLSSEGVYNVVVPQLCGTPASFTMIITPFTTTATNGGLARTFGNYVSPLFTVSGSAETQNFTPPAPMFPYQLNTYGYTTTELTANPTLAGAQFYIPFPAPGYFLTWTGSEWINLNVGYPGVTGNGANGLTVQGVVSPSTVQPSAGPVLDIRNPAFAGGAVCDGVTDIGPALQAAVNALPATGGVIQIVGTYTSPCYISNPNLITWQGNTITLQISGVLETGATFSFPTNVALSMAGKGGYAGGSFQMSGQPAQLTLVNTPGAQSGTLGTAVSTTAGTGSTVTFTPPGGIGALVAGDAITVAGVLQCSISTISTTSNTVTATMTGACHIPEGVKDFVVAGVTDSSFNGTFQLLTSNYNTNTMTWTQTGSNRSSSGGTVTGLNVDTVETVPVTSCASTTCTATFYRSHTANDVWAVATAALQKANQNITDMCISGTYGSPLAMIAGYHNLIRNTFLGGVLPVTLDETSYPIFDKDAIFVAPSATNATTMPWSIRFWNHNWTSLNGYTGMITIEDSFIDSEIQMEDGATGLYLRNVVNENPLGALVVYDTTYKTTNSGIPSVITIERTQFEDTAYTTPVWVYYPYSGTALGQQTAVSLRDNISVAGYPFVNDYFDGQLLTIGNGDTPGTFGNTLVKGVQGVYIDGKQMVGEFAGEGASMGLSAIPYATVNVNQNPSGWSGTNCTVTPGGIAPDGSTSSMVGVITASGGSCYASVGATGTMTPAVGDRILWGGWVYTPTPGASTTVNGGYAITVNGSTHFYMNGAQSVSTAQWDSDVRNNGWHVVVGMATVTSSDGTGSQRVYLTANNSNSADTFEYWMPFLIYIPASANIPLAEINRWRAQLLHGTVPSNYSGPGIPATAEPIATGGYYALNPSGGAPNLLLPGALTGYSTDGGAGTGDTVAIAKGRFTQSTLTVCPNGTNGELTTSGCSLPQATTYDFTTTTYPSGLGCSGSGGSYTCTAFPTAGHLCTVTVIQGGSGGGSGATCSSTATCYGGGGGAGGNTQQRTIPCSDLGAGPTAAVTVTVGASGPGGAANSGTSASGNAGTVGGLSKIAGASGYAAISAPAPSGGQGSGGTTSAGTGGTITQTTNEPGCPGANGASGAGGTQQCNVAYESAGGGAGGGGLAAGVTAAGGAQSSGVQGYLGGSIGDYTGGTAPGGNGQTPAWTSAAVTLIYAAFGGTGGGSNCSGNGGTGGTGMTPGGGGAGGGAACNGYSSGAGGAGGPGWVRIIVQ